MYGSHPVDRGKQQRRTSGSHKTRGIFVFISCISLENSDRSFGNGKNVHFLQNARNVMTSCVTLALREYVFFRDSVIANSRYQSMTHFNANL
jgi:hypothetical protein